jgi:hypothetical protein
MSERLPQPKPNLERENVPVSSDEELEANEDLDEEDPYLEWTDDFDPETGEYDGHPFRLTEEEFQEKKKRIEEGVTAYEISQKERKDSNASFLEEIHKIQISTETDAEKALTILELVEEYKYGIDSDYEFADLMCTEILKLKGTFSEAVFEKMLKTPDIWGEVLVMNPDRFSAYDQNKVLETGGAGWYNSEHYFNDFLFNHPEPFNAGSVTALLSSHQGTKLFLKFMPEFSTEIYDKNEVLKFIRTRGPRSLDTFIENYPEKFDEESVSILLSVKNFVSVLDHLDKFPPGSGEKIVKALAEATIVERRVIYTNLTNFSQNERDIFAHAMIEAGESIEVYKNSDLSQFSFALGQQLFLNSLKEYGSAEFLKEREEADIQGYAADTIHIKNDDLEYLRGTSDNSKYIDFVKMYHEEHGEPGFFIENINKFPESVRPQIAYYLAESRRGHADLGVLFSNLDKLGNVDRVTLMQSLTKGYGEYYLLEYLDQFKDIDTDREVFLALKKLNTHDVLQALDIGNSLNLISQDNRRLLIKKLLEEDFTRAIELNGSFTPSPDASLAEFTSIAGSAASPRLFEIWQSISGVHSEKGGGRKLLENAVAKAQSAMVDDNLEALQEVANQNEALLGEAAKAVIRYDTSDWGSHKPSDFKNAIEKYLENKDSYAPLPEGYSRKTVEVFRQRRNKNLDETKYSPEFTDRWPVLMNSIKQGRELYKEPQNLVGLYRSFLKEVRSQKRGLSQALEKAPNEKAKLHLEKRLEELESVDVRNTEGMSEAFNKLYDRKKSPELAEIFRQYGFYEAYKTIEDQGGDPEQYFFTFRPREPGVEDISKAIDFVQHMAHQETWEKDEQFASKEVQTGLDSLFHVKALENEIERMTKGGVKGAAVTMEVIPARNMLTEFSGHMADACWASHYEILKEFPNISSLTFQIDNRIAGASLMIDTETESDEPLMVIRGLNPLESTINKLNTESFVDGVVSYLQGIAQERGRKLAIVIDDHTGGSSTNRPVLFAYLSGYKRGLERVKGIKGKDTTFNGYDITEDTYYV